MKVRKLNHQIFELPSNHPARAFLEEFIECRTECVGREIALSGDTPVDQEWFSRIDGKHWLFSNLMYKYISFDIQLDGWLTGAPTLTDSERYDLEMIPVVRGLLLECREEAIRHKNDSVLELISRVEHLLWLWENCIHSRVSN
ncbi:hypothetical protein LOC68_07840 [Blastopirellula sp. JC732]|uniref:Uncharacterized protein n=1 Tax=Blastopirellula sediminis TaxID=2894196 RepID=A0A9X1SFH1_9BACT|nr:hypothetical protein [Blastopirellula sediminis]MCC9608920.1 hypothetical protein [Blastopirellula sediminis]MCC9628303.1 hypothetical protein [Blastopirellula sediminis]